MQKVDQETGEILSEPQGEELSHSRALLLLNTAATLKQAKKEAGESYDVLLRTGDSRKAPGLLRQYQLAHPEEELRDGETGVFLEKSYANTGRRLDFDNLLEKHPNIILELARRGMLSLNLKVWDAHPKDFEAADTVKGFIMPGGEVLRLEVKTER